MSGKPQIRVFGSLEVLAGNQRLGARDLGGVKPRQIFEILILARGRVVPKSHLADLLWGTSLLRNFAGSLETHVSVLRRHLGPELGHKLVVTETEAYRYGAAAADLDLDRFDELLERPPDVEPSVARTRLGQALTIARGEVLENEPFEEWAELTRRSYRARVVEVHLDIAQAAALQHDHATALDHAQAAAEFDPHSERSHRLVMLSLAALGRRPAALEHFRDYRQRLSNDLGLTPGPEIRRLNDAILSGDDQAIVAAGQGTLDIAALGAQVRLFVVDPARDRIVDANHTAAEMLGYSRDELLATPISAIHPAEMHLLRDLLRTAETNGIASSFSLTCRRRDGLFLPTESVAFPLEIDTGRYLLMLLREPSEHRFARIT